MLRTELTSTLSKDGYGHIFFALLLQLFLVERVVSGCCAPRNAFTDSCLFCAFVFISILESFFPQTTTSGFFFDLQVQICNEFICFPIVDRTVSDQYCRTSCGFPFYRFISNQFGKVFI